MKSVLLSLRDIESSLSTAERAVATYILQNADACLNLSIQQLAKQSFTSPSSVVRLCKRLGYPGYKDLKQALTFELATLSLNPSQADSPMSQHDSLLTIAKKLTLQNTTSLQQTMHLLDEHILKACVEKLLKSERILLFGMGSSYLVAQDFMLKLLRINAPCFCYLDAHIQLLLARQSSAKDVALIYSYSGETKEMLQILNELVENQTTVITITRYHQSKLTKKSDVLFIYVGF